MKSGDFKGRGLPTARSLGLRRSNTSPNQILHTFDSNLHTLLDEPDGAAQILKLKDGAGTRFASKAPTAGPRGPSSSRSPRQQSLPTAVLPQTGKYPYSEVAKTGRSSCVVCRKPIAAGSTRIVILRMIDTGSFTAPRPAYLHPECREGCPELQGLKNSDH